MMNLSFPPTPVRGIARHLAGISLPGSGACARQIRSLCLEPNPTFVEDFCRTDAEMGHELLCATTRLISAALTFTNSGTPKTI